MAYSRSSPLIKVARISQNILHHCSFIDRIPTSATPYDFPFICVIGTPRGGSTLSYQILAEAIHGQYLTNIWNLFAGWPKLGLHLNRFFSQDYHSTFRSQHGFVSGLAGEAEGLAFWKYWADQGLEKKENEHRIYQLQKLRQSLSSQLNRGEAFISGYLGHLFCMKEIREVFPQTLFIYIQRDLLSNAHSIIHAQSDTTKDFFSLKPPHSNDLINIPKEERAIQQLIRLHQEILSNLDQTNHITINYQELCENPLKNVSKVIDLYNNQFDEKIHLRQQAKLPKKFQASIVRSHKNKQTQKIQNIITIERDSIIKNFGNLSKNLLGQSQ